ncbi:MAG TPA: hypothetical protein VH593_32350 [Ktedonobacteraceae bacterium]|jgi:hypothetical protein
MAQDKNKPVGKNQQKLLLLAVAILLLIVSGSSVFFIDFEGNQETPTPPRGTTATAPTTTPTTAPATSTATAPQLLFSDEFLDNRKGWAISNASDYSRTINDGQLALSVTNHKLLVESLPTSPVTNFSLTMTFTIQQADKNDSIGLFLRGDSNLDHDYRIDLYGNSTYSISKESLNEDNQQLVRTLVGQTYTPWFHGAGQPNTITVIMAGPETMLEINGVIVQTTTNTDYTVGQIAIFVENGSTSNGTAASISRVVLTSAPQQLPTLAPGSQ